MATTNRAVLIMGAHDTYFYRCEGCRGLVTWLDEHKSRWTGRPCKCGRKTYMPTNLRWYEWFYPRVWKMVVLKVFGAFDDSASEIIHDLPKEVKRA